jgi:UDP-glucuronate decarboxylase
MRPDDGRVISNFITEAIHNKPITIYGDGKQTRAFCYIDDMTEGMIRMMDHETGEHKKERNYTKPYLSGFPGPINLGNPNEVSIISIAKRIIDMLDSKSEIIFEKLPDDDPRRRCPDISKAKNYLEWQPKISLDEGLKRTIDYFLNKVRAKQ